MRQIPMTVLVSLVVLIVVATFTPGRSTADEPKQAEANGLKADQVEFTEDGLLEIIRHYTREAGVRNLEREIGNVCRKVARRVVKDKNYTVVINAQNVNEFLGVVKFRDTLAHEKSEVGLVTGLGLTQPQLRTDLAGASARGPGPVAPPRPRRRTGGLDAGDQRLSFPIAAQQPGVSGPFDVGRHHRGVGADFPHP